MKTIILNLVILMSAFNLNAQVKEPVKKLVKLVVHINNIEEKSGTMNIALYSNETDFNNKKPLKAKHIKVDNDTIAVSFELPKGTYAILCFLDLNGNKKLDFNNYVPDEPWGLSNNVSLMGPPTWQDTEFELSENKIISIKLF